MIGIGMTSLHFPVDAPLLRVDMVVGDGVGLGEVDGVGAEEGGGIITGVGGWKGAEVR